MSEPFSSLLGQLRNSFGTTRAEKYEPDAEVAVFDEFRNADKPGVFTHGELVEGRLQEQAGLGDQEVQRFQTNQGGNMQELEQALSRGDKSALRNYAESNYTGLLDDTSKALEELIEDPDSKVRTVNQSQSMAQGRLAQNIWGKAKGDSQFRKNLARSLGFEGEVGDRELAQALGDNLTETIKNSDKIAESQKRYDDTSARASEEGITHVVTAGNLGGFADEWERLGVKVGDDFYRSAMINDHKIAVAATDARSSPERPADFNSPNAGAELSAPGVEIPVTAQDGAKTTTSGSSLAAPVVAAAAAKLAKENPELTPQQIEEILKAG